MAWQDTHSICDYPIAFRAAGSGHIANTFLGLGTSDITTAAVAQAAATTANNAATVQICDRVVGQDCAAGFYYGNNMGFTFGSTFTAYFASAPTNTHWMQMLHS